MRNFLRRILAVDASEEGRVYMLLANSFFLGAFIVTYDVTVSTLFLDRLDDFKKLSTPETSWIWREVIYKYPLAVSIVVTGLLGIIATAIFSTLQNLVSFSRLTIVNLLIILLFVSTITLAFNYFPQTVKLTDANAHMYFRLLLVAFACLGPFNAIALLGFYGTVSRAFNLKQEKRIMGTVDQGGMFATSLAFFAVPIINFTDVKTYLYISALGIFVALITQLVFNIKYATARLSQVTTGAANSNAQADSRLDSLVKNKYVRLLSLMFMLSVVANIFVDYSFLLSSSYTFPVTGDLTNFLAYYGGILTIISLIMQIFIGDNIIEQYGVKVSLLVLPILVAFFTLLAGLLGLFRDVTTGENLMFFVFIALSKLFFSVAKDTFEDPILKNFFIPLDISIRHDVQAKVEGVFRQFSWALAGVAIFAFGLISFINLEHYSFLLVVICLGYMFASVRLFDSYQFTLLDSLNLQKSKLATAKKEYSPISVMKKELQSSEPEKVIYTLKLMERIEPVLLEDSSNELVYDPSEDIRKYAIQKLDDFKTIAATTTLRNVIKLEDSAEVKKIANEALEKLNDAEIIALSTHKIYKLAKSTDAKERLLAAKLIHKSIDETNIQMLLDLMRDRDLAVRAAALISAGKTGRSEYWPLMIENLGSSMFGNTAAAALYSVGNRILPALESAFYKSGQSTEVMVKIVQMYGRFGGFEVTDYLWSKIDFPDKNVTGQVLLSLSGCAFQAEGHQATRIIQAIEQEIGNSAWSIAAYIELGDDVDSRHLKRAIIEEIESADNKIFMLLSLVYEPNSIQLVRQNIESRTSEGVVYAIELLNVFIADELKPVLFPLLDEISIHEKIEKLQEHYFREKFDTTQILIEIINRDYNYINRWTKACAMYRYCTMAGAKVTDDMVANLFNPDSLLRETAAYAIYKLDKEAYHKYTKRIGEQKKELDSIILVQERQGNKKQLQIEKVFVLKEVKAFASIHGVFLSGIADNIEEVFFKKGEFILRKGDTGNIPLYVVVEGTMEIREGEEVLSRVAKGDLIGEALVLESDVNPNDIIALENVTLYKIGKEHFYEMMSQSHEMTEGIIAGFVEHKSLDEKDNLVEELEEINKIQV
jgi:AAA family ATP:ADP antiporter